MVLHTRLGGWGDPVTTEIEANQTVHSPLFLLCLYLFNSATHTVVKVAKDQQGLRA